MADHRPWFFRIALVGWIGVIFWFSSQPDLKTDLETWQDIVLRKLAHLAEYFVLAYFWLRSLPDRPAVSFRGSLTPLVFALLVASADELYQRTVRGRQGSPGDVLVDLAGAASLVALRWLVLGRRKPLD